MTKYRIISKPSFLYPEDPDKRYYQAQYKVFNLFWKDCFPEYDVTGNAHSVDLANVERFIVAKINNERIDLSNKVVKVYE
jgi:hypothetical protein